MAEDFHMDARRCLYGGGWVGRVGRVGRVYTVVMGNEI